jgi:PAS domain S-box-containing protein
MKSLPVIRFTFMMMACVIVASLVVAWWVGRETIQRGAEIASREATLRGVQEYFSILQDAETGQRGFLLTGRQEYIEPYENALEMLPAGQARLRKAAQNGEIPAEPVELLIAFSDQKIAELKHTIELARRQDKAGVAAVVLSNVGMKKMEAIRAVRDQIVTHEQSRLHDAQAASSNLASIRTGVFVAAALLNLGFLLWAFRRIRREINRRFVADLETQRQREILAVSLASIGDAVILTDITTRIIFMNAVAEELTGWKRDEAIGKECATVFRIVNETTRAPVNSPVDLVLKSGKVVGLANHTLLIRKDSSEVPIDDSGAPVRESDGTVRGVVLVFRDFTHYKTAEREMRELKERLEAAGRAKDEFLAALSHELRTPLTPVLAMLSSWESDSDLPEAMASEVKMLSRNVRLEVRLIDDLLDLTRITRGQLNLNKEQVDAHILLEAVVEIFRGDIEARGIRIGIRAMAGRHFVECDPVRLQQVFWNILGNAVKFTPVGGRIEIVTSNDAGDLRVTFADNGRGMTGNTLSHLFRPFERAEANVTGYQPGGLGLGLTISQSLMKAQGGSIEADSSGPELGATFVVRIPALDRNTALEKQGKDEAGRNTHPPLAILLVEDHEDSAMVIGRIVSNMGHKVSTARNVADALAKLRAAKFDLVLSDIGLPDGTGIELLKQARAFTKTPMIALSGYGMEDDLQRYREAGFLHQLTKPIHFEQLEKMLREFAETTTSQAS